jgi:hypothetical protein
MDANFIPILAIGGGLATGIIITCLALYFDHRKQVMRNQERLAAIEKGIPLPAPDRRDSCGPRHRNSLYHGIKLLFIGLGLALALYVTVSEKIAVWGVFIVFIGLGHLVYWFLVERDRGGQEDGNGPG